MSLVDTDLVLNNLTRDDAGKHHGGRRSILRNAYWWVIFLLCSLGWNS
jgi:hypothetical protein